MNSTGVKKKVLFPSFVWEGDCDTIQERVIYKHHGLSYAKFKDHFYSVSKAEEDGYSYIAVCRSSTV